jgi:Asp-tRNA(Asn)/Glu-tRNA(Gln) amidotransferase A subunit family amidase
MGGSVRIPAAWCGLVGLKPGIGRIPMDVLPALFDSISHHGPLARSIDDARLFLACTQGPNDCDIQSVTTPLDLSRPLDADLSGVRIGLSIDLGSWAVEPSVEAAIRTCADHLRAAGAVVEEVPLDLGEAHDGAWTKLWGVFMASYYGHFVEVFADRLDPTVLELIRLGQSLSAVEYKKLEFVRTDMWQQLRPIFGSFDALICPTMAAGPLCSILWPRVRSHPCQPGLTAMDFRSAYRSSGNVGEKTTCSVSERHLNHMCALHRRPFSSELARALALGHSTTRPPRRTTVVCGVLRASESMNVALTGER